MKRKSYGDVDLSQLPPIEMLIPEELKNFSKEELSAYLLSKGVHPKFTKPEMKRQLRLLIKSLKEDKPEILEKLRQDGLRELVETPTTKRLTRPADFKKASAQARTRAGDADKILCLGYGCRKKANRECTLQRCRSCCNREGYLCYVHMHDGTELPPGTPLTNLTSALPTNEQSPTSTRSSTKRGTPSIYEYQPNPPIVTTSVCERCRKKVSDVASNYFLHLRDCDPEFFSLLLNGKASPVNYQDATDQNEYLSHDTPVAKAKLTSLARYQENDTFLKEIFSDDISVEELLGTAGDPEIFNARKKCLSQVQRFVGSPTAGPLNMPATIELEDALKRLEGCSDMAEVDSLAVELGLQAGVVPTLDCGYTICKVQPTRDASLTEQEQEEQPLPEYTLLL